jgi:hypothetical protein
MDTQDFVGRNEVSTGSAVLASYKKTVLGKLLLRIWDSMTNTAQEIVFSGDPQNGEETVFDVFSDKEKMYFERMNKVHFSEGSLISYTRKQATAPEVKSFEQYTDEELATVINSKYLAFVNVVGKINSVAVLFRMKHIASDLEKSEKIAKVIDARLAEVQAGEAAPTAMPVSK